MEGIIKILCLEDRKADYELARRHLMRSFPNVVLTWATNEAEFIEKLKWGTYDLVLSDYNLPGYNGLLALLYIKEHHPDLPFIFLTGMLNSEEASAIAILKGANGYVLKENVRSMPDQIREVLTATKVEAEKRRERTAVEKARNLRLQKAAGLLRKATEFDGKDKIVGLIEQSMVITNTTSL